HELNKEREPQEERKFKVASWQTLRNTQGLSSEKCMESLMKMHRDLKAQVEQFRKQAGAKRIG
ncbi:unnamed protein product, partial [Candidula unifasciata]